MCLGAAHTVLPQGAVTLLGSRQDGQPVHLPKALRLGVWMGRRSRCGRLLRPSPHRGPRSQGGAKLCRPPPQHQGSNTVLISHTSRATPGSQPALVQEILLSAGCQREVGPRRLPARGGNQAELQGVTLCLQAPYQELPRCFPKSSLQTSGGSRRGSR